MEGSQTTFHGLHAWYTCLTNKLGCVVIYVGIDEHKVECYYNELKFFVITANKWLHGSNTPDNIRDINTLVQNIQTLIDFVNKYLKKTYPRDELEKNTFSRKEDNLHKEDELFQSGGKSKKSKSKKSKVKTRKSKQ